MNPDKPQHDEPMPPATPVYTLSQADAQAVDACLSQGVGGEDVEPARAQRATQWMALMGTCPAPEPAEDLAQRTLDRLAQRRTQARIAGQIQEIAGPAIAFRWTELIAVAAMLMIGLSVLWPMLSMARQDAKRVACTSHMQAAGQAIARYAGANEGVLPRYASVAGSTWSRVGPESFSPQGFVQSNSANLYKLVREDYTQTQTLACPANPYAVRSLPADAVDYPHALAISYSYQNQFAPQPTRLDQTPRLVVLADRNPLLIWQGDRLHFASGISIRASSVLHGDSGQNTLTGDGSVQWTRDAIVNGDNIWLPDGLDRFHTFTEIPASATDSVVVP